MKFRFNREVSMLIFSRFPGIDAADLMGLATWPGSRDLAGVQCVGTGQDAQRKIGQFPVLAVFSISVIKRLK